MPGYIEALILSGIWSDNLVEFGNPMTYPRKGSSSKGKKKLLQEGKADHIAADPTSVFFSALQHSHPSALAALANYCSRQPKVENADGANQPLPDASSVSASQVENEPAGKKHGGQAVLIEDRLDVQLNSDAVAEIGNEAVAAGISESVSDSEVIQPVESLDAGELDEFLVLKEASSEALESPESSTGFGESEQKHESAQSQVQVAKSETEPKLGSDSGPGAVSETKAKVVLEPESEHETYSDSEPRSKPIAEPEQASELELEPELKPAPDSESELKSESNSDPKLMFESDSDSELEAEPAAAPVPSGETSDEIELANDDLSRPAKPSKSTKEPLRIAAAPKESPTRKGSPLLAGGGGSNVIPNAHDRGIQEEFKGVFEKATQRGGVFDAKNRDAFSSESEKKVRSSYLGLKAISFDEALTAQSEKDPALMRAQLQPASVAEPPPTIADKAKAVFSVVDMMHKTPVIIATALVCLSFLGFFVGNLYRAEGHLQDGESFFMLSKYPESIKSLSTAISLNPMRARSYFMRGRAYNKTGEPGKAVTDFSTSLQMNPNNVEALDHRASLHMRAGRYDKALVDYRNIFKLKPGTKEIYLLNNAALAARQVGKFEEALKFYDSALSVSPSDRHALVGKTLCEISMLQYGKAIEICNAIIQRDPQFLDAYVTRGWCNMSLKRDSAAMRDFDFVLERMPLNARASLNRGHLFYKAGKIDEAVRDYGTAIAGDPAFTEARTARAWAVLNSSPTLALADLKVVTASEQNSNSLKFWTLRAQLEAKLGRNLDASQSYRKAIKLAKASEPTSVPTLYARLGAVFTSMRQFDKAIDSCDEALKLDPKNSFALSIRGFAHESGGNRISALADFSNALNISPRMPEALMYRAHHYIKSKEFHSAQRDLNDYLSVRSNDQTAKKLLSTVSRKTEHSSSVAESNVSSKRRKYIGIPFAQLLNTGISELNKGNTETAAEMLTEAVRQNPSDATARRYLCHALVREDPKAAVVQFDALRSAGPLPADDERSYRHALSLAATGTLVEASAIDKAMQTVSAEPGNSQACYKLSTLYAAAGMLSKAAQYCQTGLSNTKNPAETKKFQDLYQRLSKQNVQGEQKEDIGG